jgi:hypothetical protein
MYRALSDIDLDQALAEAAHTGQPEPFETIAAEVERREAIRDARLSAPGALRNAAAWYAAHGLPVFPLKPREKRPLLPAIHPAGSPERASCHGECGRLGHGLYDATTEVEQINRWWAQHPAANIGARTGVLFDAIDIDGPDGYTSYFGLRDAGQIPVSVGWATTPGDSATGRPKGAHCYIRPTGDGNSARVMPGIDYRGAGGYVVLPPSVRPDGRYQWIEPINLAALAEVGA